MSFTINQAWCWSQNLSNPVQLRILRVGISLSLRCWIGVNWLDFLLKQEVVENFLCCEILSPRNWYCQDFLLVTQLIDLLLNRCNIKSHLFFFNHDLVFPCKIVETEITLFNGNLQLLSIELIDMLDINEFLQLQRKQNGMNLLNFFTFKFTNGQGINFLNAEKFASLCYLPIKFLNLLGKGLFILFLLSSQLSDELLFLRLFLLILCFSLLELL